MQGLPRHTVSLNTATDWNKKTLDFASTGENAAGTSNALKRLRFVR